MAIRDILAFDKSLAARLIRCLYIVALVLIAVMVVLGVVRGVRLMSRPAMPPAAMADTAAPDNSNAATPAPPPPGVQRFDERRRMMERRFGRRDFGGPRRFGMFGMGRNPVVAGLFVIFGALLRGAIILMIVRILSELGLAVLAMPRRSEI